MDRFTLAVLIGAMVAFFVGVAIMVANLAMATFGRAGVSRGLASIDTGYGVASADADVVPAGLLGSRMSTFGRAAAGTRLLARLRRRLDLAGNPPHWTVDRVCGIKGVGLIGTGLLGLVCGLAVAGGVGAVLGALAGAGVGFFGPDLVLHELSQRRQDKIRRTLPDILDTLTVSVEAGLGFDAALGQITRYGRGPLAGEFARVLQEMRIGRSRVDALRALSQRTGVGELRSFCATMVQASELGVPIANVLREQAIQMRVRRRQRAEESAQKVPVKILFPLIFCLFPAIFIVVLGPGLINIMDLFGR